MTPTCSKFQAVIDDLNTVMIDRNDAVRNSILALVTGEHYLQLGPPGTGKSFLIRQVTSRITGAVYFEKLLSQFTVPEELFGPIDLVRYADHGEYRRITGGALTEAHIVFLDECYKANSAILNSLLTIFNERLIHEIGMAPQQVPLLSLFGASNETPQDDSLKALDDRFLLREVVEYISDESSFVRMMTAKPATTPPVTVTLDDMTGAQAEVAAVKGTPETLRAILDIKQALSEQGIIVSDRKWSQALAVIKAVSWLDGRGATQIEDLCILRFVLWANPKERRTVEQTIYRVASPLHLRALEIEDQAAELLANIPEEGSYKYSDVLENTLQQMVDMHASLQTLVATAQTNGQGSGATRGTQSLDKLAAWHKQLSEKMFKAVSRFELQR